MPGPEPSPFEMTTPQVAAVCYRHRANAVEFLLVRTGSGRWTFPKGHVDPGMTEVEAAAQEAWEEAGVRGTIATTPLAIYHATRRGSEGTEQLRITAYLLEVHERTLPTERHRSPCWFSPADAREVVAGQRPADQAIQLQRVVDLAVRALDGLHPADRRSPC